MKEIDDLGGRIDALASAIEAEAEARTTQEDEARNSRRWKVGIVSVALCLVAGTIISNRAQIHEITSTREAGRVAACIAFNEQQARSRAGERAQIRSLINPDEQRTPEEEAEIEATLARHDAQVDKSYPDRDCSPEGIRTYYEERSP
jgi:hypothetical protein